MNVRFFPRQYHAAHAHQPPNFHLPYAAPYGSPNFLAAAAKPQQGEFSHSAPSNYRSAQVYPSPIQSFSLPPCCALAYTYPQGLAPQGYSRPAYDRDFTERSSGYVRKDSIWSSSPFVSYSGIRQQVARRFVDFRQARRKSQRVKFNSRRFRMSSSTALLPKDRKKPADDHVSLCIPSLIAPPLTVTSPSFCVSATLHGSPSVRTLWSLSEASLPPTSLSVLR